MQRKTKDPHQPSIIDPTPKKNPLVETVQMYFYNTIASSTLDATDISTNNIQQKIPDLLKHVIRIIVSYSRSESHIIFLPVNGGDGDNDIAIHRGNCPTMYIPLLSALLDFKSLYQSGISQKDPEYLEKKLTDLAAKVAEFPNFKIMLPQLCNFILEIKGLETLPVEKEAASGAEKETTTHVEAIPLITLDTDNVDLELIRKVFYKKMFARTIDAEERGWITYDDLESEENYIYMALPALTLIDALHQSQPYVGICLGEKMLIPDNCPTEKGFPELFEPIFELKNLLKKLSPGELMFVNWKAMQKPAAIPVELARYEENTQLTHVAGIFNGVAVEISQRKLFQQMIPEVIENCLAALTTQQELHSRLKMK